MNYKHCGTKNGKSLMFISFVQQVPFGEVTAIRDWLGISGPVGKPPSENAKRPVLGFECTRSEVSNNFKVGKYINKCKKVWHFTRPTTSR